MCVSQSQEHDGTGRANLHNTETIEFPCLRCENRGEYCKLNLLFVDCSALDRYKKAVKRAKPTNNIVREQVCLHKEK